MSYNDGRIIIALYASCFHIVPGEHQHRLTGISIACLYCYYSPLSKGIQIVLLSVTHIVQNLFIKINIILHFLKTWLTFWITGTWIKRRHFMICAMQTCKYIPSPRSKLWLWFVICDWNVNEKKMEFMNIFSFRFKILTFLSIFIWNMWNAQKCLNDDPSICFKFFLNF